MNQPHLPRVGLVLGSGGLAGYAFGVAAVHELSRITGWDPRHADVMLGTSAGSSIAAALRGGVNPTQLAEHLTSLDTDPSRMAAMQAISAQPARLDGVKPSSWRLVEYELRRGRNARPMSVISGLLPRGGVSTSPVGRFAAGLHDEDWPERELWLVAIDLETGRRRVFGRNDEGQRPPVAAAVEASSAIPGYFKPVEWGATSYVDGGIRSPNNADLLRGADLDAIIVISPQSATQRPMRSPIQTVLRAGSTRRTRFEIEALRRNGTQLVIIEPPEWVRSIIGLNPMDATRMTQVYAASAAAVAEQLKSPGHAPVVEWLSSVAQRVPPMHTIEIPGHL